MSTYLCNGCEYYYCTACEPGEDQCKNCFSGPRCPDCAAEHRDECPEPDYCAECGAAYNDGDEDEDYCSDHRGYSGDGPPYDAATRTGMYDRD